MVGALGGWREKGRGEEGGGRMGERGEEGWEREGGRKRGEEREGGSSTNSIYTHIRTQVY